MKLRLATFNVENLFTRPRALNAPTTTASREVLNDIAKLTELIEKPIYSDADKAAIRALLEQYQVESKPGTRPFFINEVRGKLYSKPAGKPIRIDADGRGDWDGWVELEQDGIGSKAIENTARVIAALDADVLCLVEVENRTTLQRFLDKVVHQDGFVPAARRYEHNMLIVGNDERGINVALVSRFPIAGMRSHIDDKIGNSRIFSRDCPEYEVLLPAGRSLWILPNHLKSKGYGSPAANNARRERQAKQVRAILAERFDLARDFVVVAGDFNDTPDSAPLQPLLTTPRLKDALDSLPAGSERWTYRAPKHQIDYLLLSEPLSSRLTGVGIERRGLFHPTAFGGKFPHFPEVTSDKDAASDHAAVFVDLEL